MPPLPVAAVLPAVGLGRAVPSARSRMGDGLIDDDPGTALRPGLKETAAGLSP